MTAASAIPELPRTAPTPAELDEYLQNYLRVKSDYTRLQEAASEAKNLLDEMGDNLRTAADKFGSAHAEKSKLLHGIRYEVMVTFGMSSSIDASAVERFRLALLEHKQSRLLKKLFEKTVRWTLNPAYATVIKAEKLSKSLVALWAQCQVVKEATPKLVVREKVA